MYQPAWLPDVAHHVVRRESELRCGTRGRLQPPGSSSWNFKPLISLDGATGLAAAVLRPNFIPVVALIEGSLFVCLMNGRVMGLVCFPAFFTPIFWLMCKVDASCLKQGCKLLSLISSFAGATVLLKFLFVFPSCSNSCTAVGDAGCLIAVRQAEEISCPSVLSKERAVYSWWDNEKENQDKKLISKRCSVTGNCILFFCFPRPGEKKCFKCMGDPGRTLAVLLTVVLIFPKSCHIQGLEYLNVKSALTTYDMRTLQEKSVRQMKSLIAEENGKYGNNLIAH